MSLSSSPIVVLEEGTLPGALDADRLYATSDLSVRDALVARGVAALFQSPGITRPPERLRRQTVSVPTGTLFLDEGRFDAPSGSVRLSPQLRRLAAALADGEWHEADDLAAALFDRPSAPSRLHSALARLRRTVGDSVENAYGGSWRLRRVGPPRPAATLLDLLDRDQPISAAALAGHLGCSSAAVRARVHRLRASGVAIRSTPGGYRLEHDPESPRQALVDAMASRPIVQLWGPIGVGKTFLLRSIGGASVVSLAGLDAERLARRVLALASQTPRTLFVDDLEDPEIAEALRRAGHRVVCAGRRPMPGVATVAYPPWTPHRLARVFPEHDTTGWDGLPLGACSDDDILERVPHPAVQTAAALPWAFHPASLGREDHAALLGQGLLVGEGRQRLVGPVLRAVRSRWSADRWQVHIRAFCDKLHALTAQRHHLEVASLAETEGRSLLRTARELGLPAGRLLVALYDIGALDTPDLLLRACSEPDEPEVLAHLRHRAWLVGPEDDGQGLEEAIAVAPEALANELRVELAYHLYRQDRQAALALFDQVAAWLTTQPEDAHPWIRNEWLVSLALQDPLRVPVEQLIARYQQLVALGFTAPPRRLAWMKVQCLQAIGRCAMARDDLTAAIHAYEILARELGESFASRGGIDLLLAYTRRRDWEAAEAHWEQLRRPELSPAWEADRRSARCLMLLGQGYLAEAAAVARDLPAGALVRDLIAVLQGALPARPKPEEQDVLERVHLAVRSGAPEDLASVRSLPTWRYFSGLSLAAIVEARLDASPDAREMPG